MTNLSVNDYVIWNSRHLEGWIYFKGNEYITIEIGVKPKHPDDANCGTHHRNDRLLVLCYFDQWKELTYVKSRESVYETVETVGKGIRRKNRK
jgi:hypothetical protein